MHAEVQRRDDSYRRRICAVRGALNAPPHKPRMLSRAVVGFLSARGRLKTAPAIAANAHHPRDGGRRATRPPSRVIAEGITPCSIEPMYVHFADRLPHPSGTLISAAGRDRPLPGRCPTALGRLVRHDPAQRGFVRLLDTPEVEAGCSPGHRPSPSSCTITVVLPAPPWSWRNDRVVHRPGQQSPLRHIVWPRAALTLRPQPYPRSAELWHRGRDQHPRVFAAADLDDVLRSPADSFSPHCVSSRSSRRRFTHTARAPWSRPCRKRSISFCPRFARAWRA